MRFASFLAVRRRLRTGKSGWLAGRVIDAPGAVLVTSTRTDLHALTVGLRARRGPVYVFNAVGLGDLPSTVTFDPLTGCNDPVTAAERAADLLAAGATVGGGGDRAFWDSQARRVLAALLHAAALGRLSMATVLEWVANPEGAAREVTSLLRRSPQTSYVEAAEQFLTTNDRTRTSITATIMPALGWLTSPAACAAATGGTPFDVATLLRERGTVYLLGAEDGQTAPLVTALTAHIAREARRIAARAPGGRLDPPLTLALDEAALISPVPLESWTADMGGRGVSIIAAFQSRAQVIARWGETGASVILNNSGSVMVFGGTKDRDDLAYWSALARSTSGTSTPCCRRAGHGTPPWSKSCGGYARPTEPPTRQRAPRGATSGTGTTASAPAWSSASTRPSGAATWPATGSTATAAPLPGRWRPWRVPQTRSRAHGPNTEQHQNRPQSRPTRQTNTTENSTERATNEHQDRSTTRRQE